MNILNVIFAAKVYSLKKMLNYERLGIIAILHGNSDELLMEFAI